MTSWNVVLLLLTELSVVPVASKKTSSGEIPVDRTVLAFNDREPLVVEQAPAAAGPVGAGGATATVTLCVADPPVPVQLRV